MIMRIIIWVSRGRLRSRVDNGVDDPNAKTTTSPTMADDTFAKLYRERDWEVA